MIVLNEVLYAEEWLEKDVPWKKAGHVLHYAAKYYFYKGYSKDDVREKLNEYMLRHFEGYNKVLDRELIDKAIASAKGRPMVELGFIGFASLKKIDNLNIHVLIAEPDSPHEIFVDDFENAGILWSQYCGKEYIKCDCCGKMVARTGRRQKYCRKCAKNVNIEKTAQNRKNV